MFRYRPLDKILDENELQNNSIYLPSGQADKYEMWTNFYWAGDKIVWKNLLIHFYLTMSDVLDLGFIEGKNDVNEKIIRDTFKAYISFNFTRFKKIDLKERGLNWFLDDDIVHQMLDYFGDGHKVSMQEMKLRILELCPVFFMAHSAYVKGVTPSNEKNGHNIIKWNNEDYARLQRLWTDFIFKISIPRDDHGEFVEAITNFPKYYLSELIKIGQPYAYILSFTKDPLNAAMWTMYTGNKGVCLEYKRDDGLRLRMPTSYSEKGVGYSWQNWPYSKTVYVAKRSHEFDSNFFMSITRLQNQYAESFYIDSQGNVSSIFNDMFNFDVERYKRLWCKWASIGNTKIQNWSYEKEYRILIQSEMEDFESKDQKTIQYDPSELKSITFGSATPEEAKFKIRNIVQKKWGEGVIKFYQQEINEEGEIIRTEA